MFFKSIGINTFNIIVMDLETKKFRFWYEGHHLWESPICGLLLQNKEFMTLSKDGITILAVGRERTGVRVIKDQDDVKTILHPLTSCEFLRISPTNFMLFAFQRSDCKRIKVQEQYSYKKCESDRDEDAETCFDDIYQIKVDDIDLRELLMLRSLYKSASVANMQALINEQPNPRIFFKVFLELDLNCLLPFISFDNQSISKLLNDKNCEYFPKEYPLFFLDQRGKSAIDYALE